MPVKFKERDAAQISRSWKFVQILLHFIAFIGGLIACIPLEKVRGTFHGNCVLNAHLSLLFLDGRVRVNEDPAFSTWGSSSSCSFCLYSTVCSSIYAFVFGWFYAVCPRGGRPTRWGISQVDEPPKDTSSTSSKTIQLAPVEYSPRKPWRLVFPSLVFSCNFAIVLAIVSALLVNGVSEFCKDLSDQSSMSCRALQDVPWENFHMTSTFYENLIIAEMGCWISVFAWFAIAGLGFMRCCMVVDFIAPTAASVSLRVRHTTPTSHSDYLTPDSISEPSKHFV